MIRPLNKYTNANTVKNMIGVGLILRVPAERTLPFPEKLINHSFTAPIFYLPSLKEKVKATIRIDIMII
jgi:hypothetical protein